MDKYYTVDEVAAMTGLTSRTIRTYISQGRLTGMRLGKQWRFTEEDISRLYSSVPRSKNRGKKSYYQSISAAVTDFLSEKHDSLTVCIVADCAGLPEHAVSELENRLRQILSSKSGTVREGNKFVFDSSPEEAAEFLSALPADL